jgi:potassium-dependent mechanosensitive channel
MRISFSVWCRSLRQLLQTAIIVALIAGLPVAVPAQAQSQTAPADFKAALSSWQAALEKAAGRLSRGNLEEAEYEALRAELSSLFDDAREASADAANELGITQQLADALGAPPAEGAPPEAQAVALDRQRLARTLAELDGHRRQAELIATRADILIRTATDKRMQQFTDALFRRGPLPLDHVTWNALPAQGEFLRDRVSRAFSLTAADPAWRQNWIGLAGVFLLAIGIAWSVRRLLLGRFGHRSVTFQPTYRQRVVAMAVEAIGRCLLTVLPILALAAVLLTIIGTDNRTASLQAFTVAAAGGISFFLFFSGLGRAILAPDHSAWQLTGLDPASARALVRRITLFAASLAVAGGAVVLQSRMLSPPELQAVTGFASQLLATCALLLLLPAKLWRTLPAEREPPTDIGVGDSSANPTASPAAPAPDASQNSWVQLRFLGGAVALAALGASLTGYHNLSIYVAMLSLAAVAVAGMLLLVRGVARELLTMAMEREQGPVAEVRRLLVRSEKGVEAAGWVGRVLIDVLLIALGAAVLLPLSGIDWSEIQGMYSTFMRGVTIGGVRLAPADMIAAFMLFSLAVMVTRYVQRVLDVRVLQRLQLDRGVQNSIRTGVGYFGFMMAMLVAIGALGLDLSNLALIAGALSVGIGFGLQNVVSNFVAGLILLVERPIKVGDWVIVGDKEGVVKRISVRATELQTFQRASVIIPNSELVSTSVVNWTFKDKFGRIDIKIGVEYGSDLKLVRETLLACAHAHPRVARMPGPQVVFRDFGASSLDFELRCFVADVDFFLSTASDLRFAIVESFQREGIEIPFNQQVMHIPQLDGLKDLLERRAAPPAKDTASAPPLLETITPNS